MVFKLGHKRLIGFLVIGLLLIGGVLLYKEQTTNKQAPKRANFVLHVLEGRY